MHLCCGIFGLTNRLEAAIVIIKVVFLVCYTSWNAFCHNTDQVARHLYRPSGLDVINWITNTHTCVAVFAMSSQASIMWSTAAMFLCLSAATLTTSARVSRDTRESTNRMRMPRRTETGRGRVPFLNSTRAPNVHVALSMPGEKKKSIIVCFSAGFGLPEKRFKCSQSLSESLLTVKLFLFQNS